MAPVEARVERAGPGGIAERHLLGRERERRAAAPQLALELLHAGAQPLDLLLALLGLRLLAARASPSSSSSRRCSRWGARSSSGRMMWLWSLLMSPPCIQQTP